MVERTIVSSDRSFEQVDNERVFLDRFRDLVEPFASQVAEPKTMINDFLVQIATEDLNPLFWVSASREQRFLVSLLFT